MATLVTKVDVWAGEIPDRSGGLADLLETLAGGGAKIECVIARRQPEKPGSGVAFISPIKGKKAQDAARRAGMQPARDIATLRVEGTDRPGVGASLTSAIADLGISMRGLSAAVIGNKYVAYFGFDNADDATRAMKAIKQVDARRPTVRRSALRR
jgi:hypothetical protein